MFRFGWSVPVLLIPAAVVFAFGLWVSFHYSLGVWRPDNDNVVNLVLWDGIKRHGWAFIPSWEFTPDNWLLSLAPIIALSAQLFGAEPILATVIGWLIFVACTGMTAALATRLSAWRAGLALGCILIFAGFAALGWTGYLSHPTSHDISMAWALLALLLAHHGIKRGRTVPCLGAGLCIFVDALSDPWAAAAIGVPMILAGAAVAAANRRSVQGRCAALLSVAALLAMAAAWTQLFGLMDFLSKAQFAMTDRAGAVANLVWAGRAISTMANIVPFGDLEARSVRLIDAAALLAMLGTAIVATIADLRRADPERQLVSGVALLSMAAVAAAFAIGQWPPGLNVGRFFPNIYFLGALLAAIAAADRWQRWSPPLRAVVVIYAALFMASGLASRPVLWMHPEAIPAAAEAVELAGFLSAHNLVYGYGTYWNSNALIMDWASGGRVLIRPVSFQSGQVRRRPAETSSFWYLPADEPAGLQKRFMIVQNDGEECPEVTDCVAMATHQFGPPSESLVHKGAMILIWPAPIASRIAP
jgi:hypothetical protein